MDDEALGRLEDGLAEAHFDPTAWRRAADAIVSSARARGAALLPVRGRVPNLVFTEGVEALSDEFVRGGWTERDTRTAGLPTLFRKGLVVDQDFVTPETMARDPLWVELLEPQGFRWFCGLLVRAGDDLWCFTLQRTPAQGPFDVDDQARLLRFAAPLSRAATLTRSLDEARLDGAVYALDALSRAAFVLDRQGRVVRHNAGADDLLGDVLTLRNGFLTVRGDPKATAALARHARAVHWSTVSAPTPDLSPVAVSRPGQRPLVLQAHALRGPLSGTFGAGRLLVIAADLGKPPEVGRDALSTLFGLTPGEERLALAVASGLALPDAARKAGFTYETARSYIKRVYTKTEVRGQAELAALLAQLGK